MHQLHHGWRANVSLLTWQTPRGPCSRLSTPSGIPPRAPALLAEDLLAAGVKFPTGTCSPMDGDMTWPGSPTLHRLLTPLACFCLLWVPISKKICELKAT